MILSKSISTKPLTQMLKLFVTLLIIIISSINVTAYAQNTEKIDLYQLDDGLKNGLMLKNAYTYRDVYFTKPQTWKILPGSKLVLQFHHSTQLIPDRSFMNIYINGKLVKKEKLDESSDETKTIAIPLPVSGLGDYNTLRFEVEQHYTDHCEDPLDHSLWTRLHQDSHIEFNYSIVQPKVDLAKYPFPLYDPFAYGTTQINFVAPQVDSGSTKSMTALGIVASDIAQKISWHDLKYLATMPNETLNNNLNTVLVGTPTENPAILKLNSALGNPLKESGGKLQFVDKQGQPIDENNGLIYFINNPQNKNRAILIVTGNSPEGVYKAARYLANETLGPDLKGNHSVVTNYNPGKETPSTIAKYLHNQSLTFKELGYEERKAERIGSPPLKYYIRVMPDMNTTSEQLAVNLRYSYGPRLNDELSTLEVIFNDIALKSVRLNNTNGEKDKTLSVDIPSQYVKPYNILEIRFNMYPFKYDYCKDWYDDDLWGLISEDSTMSLPSDAKVIFPNLGLLNDALYPYSTLQDLSNTAIIMPDAPTKQDYQAMLNTVGAISKVTDSDAGINVEVATSNSGSESSFSDRNIIYIGTSQSNSAISKVQDKLYFNLNDSYKELKPYQNQKALLAYFNDQGVLEQVISHLNSAKVITVIHGKTEQAVDNASTALSEKEKLTNIKDGNFFTVDKKLMNKVSIPKEKKEQKTVSTTETSKLSTFWPPSGLWGWVTIAVVGFVILFVLAFILRIIASILFGRKGN